ncbi:MAG: c-type cytochrome [Proteobacteria bacterium]|nr:c-type cytochrome [Pseudomonadota bacterium]
MLAQPLPGRLQLCDACHGPGGNSQIAGTPSLAAQPVIFLENQLVLLREGMREVPQMAAAVQGLKDAEIRAIARHYASQRPAPPRGSPDAALMKRGAALAGKLHCGSCHEADFRGREQMPRLATQREEYLVAAMNSYRDYTRKGGDTMMAAALYSVSDADVKALAHYLVHTR